MNADQAEKMILRFLEGATCFVHTKGEERIEVDGIGSRGFSVHGSDPEKFIPVEEVLAIEDPTLHLQSDNGIHTCCGRLLTEVDCAGTIDEATCPHCTQTAKNFLDSLLKENQA